MKINPATIFTCGCVLLLMCGCRPSREERKFNQVLISNRIDRVVFVDQDNNVSNVVSGPSVSMLLARFAPSNRSRYTLWNKSYISGGVEFIEGDQRRAYLAYFPHEQILGGNDFNFQFRDTNNLAELFKCRGKQ